MVAALIEDGDRVLLDRRPEGGHMAGLWEFPGGKREPGEDDRQALARELLEELGARATIGAEVARVTHAYEALEVTLVLYEARLLDAPRAAGVPEIRWFPRAALTGLPMPAADVPLVEAVLRRPHA